MLIYRLYDENKNVIYVGKTKMKLIERLQNHLGVRHVRDLWKINIRYFDYTKINTDEATAEIYETYYINQYKTVNNCMKNFTHKTDIKLQELNFSNLKSIKETINNNLINWNSKTFKQYLSKMERQIVKVKNIELFWEERRINAAKGLNI